MAGALRSVRVESAHAAVRPRIGIDDGFARARADHLALLVALELDDRAVALPAAVDRVGDVARFAGDLLGENIVEAGEDLARLGVMALGELVVFLVVTLRAVLGRYQRRHVRAV